MSARETLANSPLIPTPIADQWAGREQRLAQDDDTTETVDLYGYCAWWCNIQQAFELPQGKSGNTIEEHCDDPFCMSQIGRSHEATGTHGHTTYVGVELFVAYTHGVYRRDDRGMQGTKIALTLSSGNDHCDEGMVFIDPSRARSLAAALLRAADELEGIGRGSL